MSKKDKKIFKLRPSKIILFFIVLSLVVIGLLVSASVFLQSKTFLILSSPSGNEVLAGNFLDIAVKTQISPLGKSKSEHVTGKLQAKLVNTKDQSEQKIDLQVIAADTFNAQDEISFGREKNYKYGQEYTVKTVAYIPDVEEGTYTLSVDFNEISGKTVLSTDPAPIQIKHLDTHKNWLSVTPEEHTSSFATLTFESTENTVEVKAIEMGTEDGGVIRDAINFSLYNSETEEKIADLVDLRVHAKTLANYNLYYLSTPIILESNQKLTVDLRGVPLHTKTPDSEINQNERSRVDFTITGVHGQTKDHELIHNMLEIPAFVITDPSKIIRIDIKNPQAKQKVSGTSMFLKVDWMMFYPSSYLKEGEIPGFSILVCKDPEGSCPISKLEPARTPYSSEDYPLDKEALFTYLVDVSGLENGRYEVIVTATSARYEGQYFVSGMSQYQDKVKFTLER